MTTGLENIKFPLRWIGIILIAAAVGIAFVIMGKKVPEVKSEIAAVQAQIDSLKTTENNLSGLLQEQEKYRKETREKEENTARILKEFPTFMYLEDKILFADRVINDKNGLGNYTIKDFTYGQSNYVTSVTVSENVTLELYSVSLSGSYSEATYKDVKNLINYGFGSENRFVLRSITMGYDEETGYLRGDLNFTTYFMPGQPEPYEFPEEILSELGNTNREDDLFGARTERSDEMMDPNGEYYEGQLDDSNRQDNLFGGEDAPVVVTN